MIMQEQIQSIEGQCTGAFVAALSIDGLRLLLPHQQIRTLEPVADVEAIKKQNIEIGWITIAGIESPVYCFSRDLSLLHTIPDERRITVLLGAGNDTIGILCDELKIVPSKELIMHPLPDCMKVPGSPFTGLAILDDTICCLSSSQHMLNYLTETPEALDIKAQS